MRNPFLIIFKKKNWFKIDPRLQIPYIPCFKLAWELQINIKFYTAVSFTLRHNTHILSKWGTFLHKIKIFGFLAHSRYSTIIWFVMAAKTETDICFDGLEKLKQDKALTVLSCGHKLHFKCQFSYSVAKKTGRMLRGMCRAPIMNEQEG